MLHMPDAVLERRSPLLAATSCSRPRSLMLMTGDEGAVSEDDTLAPEPPPEPPPEPSPEQPPGERREFREFIARPYLRAPVKDAE